MSRIAVVGAGYVGMVNAACLAELGHSVVLIENDPLRRAEFQRGTVAMMEPGLASLVQQNVEERRLTVTGDYAEAGVGVEYAMIAVSTPAQEDGRHNLSDLWAAIDSLSVSVERDATIVILSTVPPGTTDAVSDCLHKGGRSDLHVAVLPEFFREGHAVRDAWNPARVIVGCRDHERGRRVADLWQREGVPTLLTDPPTAELAKLAANSFLATKISLINEVADHAARVGADVTVVSQAVGLDPRIGPDYLSAGLGFGGSCLPKDLEGLARQIEASGGTPHVLDAVMRVNRGRSAPVLALLRDSLGVPAGQGIAVLGVTFKPGTSDRRDSASVALARALADVGYEVRVTDPTVGIGEVEAVSAEIGHGVCALELREAIAGAHAVVLATEWPEYCALDWRECAVLMAGRVVVDGRNVLDPAVVRAEGFEYVGIGRQ